MRKRTKKATARKKPARRRKYAKNLKMACMAAGLSTAWAADADASTLFRASITPNQTITNAKIYYHNGVTTSNFFSLGLLPANQESVFFHTVPLPFFPFADDVLYDISFRNPGYVIVGLYEGQSETGVSVTFPNDDVITAGLTWDEAFATPDPFSSSARFYTEEEVVDTLTLDQIPTGFLESYEDYYDSDAGRRIAQLVTYFDQEATLVNFSTAALGGTAIVEAVPEPPTVVLLVGAAGVLLLIPKRKSR